MTLISERQVTTGSKFLATSIALSVFATFGIGSASASSTLTPTPLTSQVSGVDQENVSDEDVVEVTDSSGAVIGYSVASHIQVELDTFSSELVGQNQAAQKSAGTDNFFHVAQCVGAVSAFIALTVFPTARAAKVAVSLGKLVSKYGVQKTAQILTRTYKGNDIDAQKIFADFAKEAAGIGALSVCFNPI